MKLEEIVPRVFHVNFETQIELTSTFLRFQEHFESPKFKGKIFTLEEYKKWYTTNSKKGRETGEFTYYTDWTGFNFPSTVLEPFYYGRFNPLSEAEEMVLTSFRDKRSTDFYVIGTYGKESRKDNALKHEIAHGLFFVNQRYRGEVIKVLHQIPSETRGKFNSFLGGLGGYHPDVWEDETHAYVVEGLDKLERKHNVDVSGLRSFEPVMNEIFDRYTNQNN